jgi:excisionase family DNA binding protein
MTTSGPGPDVASRHVEVSNKDDEKAVPFAERLTCTISDACQATGISRAKLYQLLSDGSVSSTTVGRRRLVHVRSLKTLVKES